MMRQKIFGPLNPQYEDYAGMIFESGQLLLNLVSDILDLAKIEAGKFTLDLQTVTLAPAVQSCLRLVKKRADDRHITLAPILPETPIQLVADPRAVKQILLNLLSNAVKFTPEGGRIDVICECAGEMVKIIVRDNGVGIPVNALKRIGHAFEQASNDPTRAREGTGLGLALVRALADQHGGRLSIDSVEYVGTTVTVELPQSRDTRQAA
jgi:signal transduction histidine kinase